MTLSPDSASFSIGPSAHEAQSDREMYRLTQDAPEEGWGGIRPCTDDRHKRGPLREWTVLPQPNPQHTRFPNIIIDKRLQPAWLFKPGNPKIVTVFRFEMLETNRKSPPADPGPLSVSQTERRREVVWPGPLQRRRSGRRPQLGPLCCLDLASWAQTPVAGFLPAREASGRLRGSGL